MCKGVRCMLYSVTSYRSAEYLMMDTIFTEPVFLLFILLIPAGIYLVKKDFSYAKFIGILSVAAGTVYILSRILYNL